MHRIRVPRRSQGIMETMSAPAGGALPPDLMLAHAGSIRALALSILGDEHAAEDVLQETWLRALNKPPPRQDSIGGWLRRVAEGIAISRLRSEGRRRTRETHWVEDRDCSHTSYDATERAEVLRAVVDEVLALDEPYRETIMRRYFEGLPPRDIAAATDASVATVNSRLQRAQSKLRDRLDRRLSDRCGGMNGALLALVGWPEHAIATSAAGIFTKAVAWKLGVGAVGACAIVAAALWIGGAPDDARPVDRAAVAQTAPSTEAVELAEARSVAAERSRVVEPLAPAVAAIGTPLTEPRPAEFAFDLSIEPIDAVGRAVAGCRVWLGPEPGPLALVGSTDWDGALHIAWRGDDPEAQFVVRAARAGSGSTPLRRVRVRADVPQVVRLLLDSSRVPEVEVPVRSGMPIVGTNFSSRPQRDEGRFLQDSAENGVFLDPWLLAGSEATKASNAFAVLAPLEPLVRADAGDANEPRPGLEVRVTDEAGRPVERAGVLVDTARGALHQLAYTGADGIVVWPDVPAGPAVVTIAAPNTPFPVVQRRIDRAASGPRSFDIVLPSVPTARVRLVDAKGAARAGWLIELRDAFGSSIGRGVLDAEGRATLAIPGNAPAQLLARADATGPGVLIEPELLPLGFEQVLTAAFDPHVRSLRVVVHGEDLADVMVRVMRVDSGDAIDAAPVAEFEPGDGADAAAFRARGLSHGTYRIAVGSPQRGWLDAGVSEITGGRGSEVLHVDLGAPSALEIASSDADRVRLLGHRAGMRITSIDARAAKGEKLRAAPGALELLIERAEMQPTLRSVQLTPGATTQVQ